MIFLKMLVRIAFVVKALIIKEIDSLSRPVTPAAGCGEMA